MEKKKQRVWLSYDLGIRGNYSSLYEWLDKYNAKECGDSVATFIFEYSKNSRNELLEDLESNVELDENARIYLISTTGGKIGGRFIKGRRKSSPWEGYYSNQESNEDDSEL